MMSRDLHLSTLELDFSPTVYYLHGAAGLRQRKDLKDLREYIFHLPAHTQVVPLFSGVTESPPSPETVE